MPMGFFGMMPRWKMEGSYKIGCPSVRPFFLGMDLLFFIKFALVLQTDIKSLRDRAEWILKNWGKWARFNRLFEFFEKFCH